MVGAAGVNQTSKRLYPDRTSSRYYPLRRLREEMEGMAGCLADQLELAGDSGRDSVLLDFGCGDMPYKPIFAPRVGRYLGIDLAGNASADVHAEAVDVCPALPDQMADVVLSTQVLEHVERPETYLAECHRLLKEGGLLVLSTHGYWPYHPSPNDYWRWTGAGLRKILGESGFQVVQLRGIMGLAATSVQLFQDAFMRRVHPWFRPLFFWTLQGVAAICDKIHSAEERLSDACIFVALARKESRLDDAG